MAAASARFPLLPPPTSPRRTPPVFSKTLATPRCRCQAIPPPLEGIHHNEVTSFGGAMRRETLVQLLLSAITIPILPTKASAETDLQESFRSYEDQTNKFQISIPKEWMLSAGEGNSFKSVTAFYPPEASDTNVSVVITALGPDFTRLESFGNVDGFAETLVSGMDRSWQRPPGVAAKLIDSKSSKGLYYIEYTLQNPGERRRHILTALGVASNGWYNRLYTVTGQYMEDQAEGYRQEIEKSVSSFRFL